MDAYVFEADLYCEDCAPEGAESFPDGGGEADTPHHCGTCMVPLENPLTGEGVNYVLEAISHTLAEDPAEWEKVYDVYKDTYYENTPHVTIVRDWALHLLEYNLSESDHHAVDEFLERTAKAAGESSLGDAMDGADQAQFMINEEGHLIQIFKTDNDKYRILEIWPGGQENFLYSYDDRTTAFLSARRIAHQKRSEERSKWHHYEFLTEWTDGDPDPNNEMELYLFYPDKQDERGKEILAYRFYDGPYMIFEGMDFSPSPLHAIDSPDTIASLLNFLSLDEGDTDAEYFEDYSKEQIEWRDERVGNLKDALMDFQATFGLDGFDADEEGEDEVDSPEDSRIGKLSGGLGFSKERPADFEQNFPSIIIPVLRRHEDLNLHKGYDRIILSRDLAPILGVNEDALLHYLTRNHADIALNETNMKKLAVAISAWMRSGTVKIH